METKVTRRTQLSILAVGLLSFIGILIETSMNLTFPTLITQLHVSLSTIQWVTTGYLLLVTIVMGTTAYLLKRFDGRTIFRFAIICCLIGTILCGIAPNFTFLIFGRLFQAISTGLSTPLMFNIILTSVPKFQLGVYTGLAAMVVFFAPALGPTYGGLLNHALSWRWIFWIALPIIIIVAFLGNSTIHTRASHQHGAFDFYGLALVAVIFASLVWTFNEAGTHGFMSGQFWGWLIVFLLLMGIQLWHMGHGKRELLDWSILKMPLIRLRLTTYFLLQFTNIGISFVIPLYAENVLGANSMVAGMILFPGALLGAITAPLAGRIYDKRGGILPIMISNVFLLIGTGLFATLTNHLTLGLIAIFFMVLRLGFNFGFGNLMSDASKHVAVHQKADQNSLFNMMQQYAGSLGTGVLSAIISAHELTIRSTEHATRQGSHVDFVVLVVLALIAFAAALVANRYILKERKQVSA
ncbi:MFS transporter permease [Secundilactobacillus paracollinoides]|uniref:MFS transporter n=1 Tax=Secundilactobacillus paracollinoides TaxID=240427 RepID=UPI00081AAC17|nr:MFS transporter [Secundilactobacillus paracollinoides]ANZ64520.1 MFS transporter permease [Secundilactobacillus paracollinoides]